MVSATPQNSGEWPDDFFLDPSESPDQAALDELAEAAMLDRIDGDTEVRADEERVRARYAILIALSHHVSELETENGSDAHPFTPELDEFHGLAEQLMRRFEITMEEIREHAPHTGHDAHSADAEDAWHPEWN